MPSSPRSVLVTGGAGYIGSHTCLELLNAGFRVTVVDNFSNGHPEALRRVESLCGKKVRVIQGDIRDERALVQLLRDSAINAVVHLAGRKAVGESTAMPLAYYDDNVCGSLTLLRAMKAAGTRTLVFSSSSTVYGEPRYVPIDEGHPLSPINPYGRTKLFVENALRDLHASDPSWRICILRYFNPVGAHESGLIGEDPHGLPGNLMPLITQVAIRRRMRLSVWGTDYATTDGTGVRDYIHVVDLARGHLRALDYLDMPRCCAINLGTGRGYSVLEMIKTFEIVCGRLVPYEFAARRPGDVAASYADCAAANRLLNWRAEHHLRAMCADHWRWQCHNPRGYASRDSPSKAMPTQG